MNEYTLRNRTINFGDDCYVNFWPNYIFIAVKLHNSFFFRNFPYCFDLVDLVDRHNERL
jgi:hypothetical protein